MTKSLQQSKQIEPQAASDKKLYFPAIDGLRAIAVIAVILFHLEFELFSGGFVGVDIFFVISGYLITRNIYLDICNQTFSFKEFYNSRVRRIFPAMIATVIVSLFVSTLLFSPEHLEQNAEASIAAIFSVANIYFWNISGYFDSDAVLKPLLHFWSLSVEEQFYFFWPALLVLSLKVSKNHIAIIAQLLVLAILSTLMAENTLAKDQDLAFYWVHLRINEFICGAILVWLEQYNTNSFNKTWQFLTGILLISFSILTFNEATTFPGLNSLIPCIGAALIILAKDSHLSEKLLANKPSLWVGKTSYSLYLVHWPIWVFYSYWTYNHINLFDKFCLIIAILFAGYLLHKNVENRYRLKKKHHKTPSNNKPFYRPLTIHYISITLIAIGIAHSNGWQWRVENKHTTFAYKPFSCEELEKIEGKQLEKRCLLGDLSTSKKSILLLGDSHAEHLRAGLHEFGLNNAIKFEAWTFAGCPPIWQTYKIYGLNFRKPLPRQQYCKELIQRWRQKIKDSQFDAVILSSRWMWLYESTEYGNKKPLRRDLLVDSKKPVLEVEASKRVFQTKLQATVNEIISDGSKVIVFSQPPLLGKNTQGCDRVPNLLYSSENLKHRCDSQIDYNSQIQRLKFTDQTIRSLKTSNMMPAIPSDYICTTQDRYCRTLINNQSIYLDDNHLNHLGSRYIVQSISDELKSFLNL